MSSRSSLRPFLWLGPITVFLSIAVVLLIRIVAVTWLHPLPSFLPLRIMPPIVDTAALVIWAVLIFGTMVRFVSDPIRKFKAIAFIVLLISFLPDIVLVKWQVWGATWSYAFALMAMHVAAWATSVTLLARLCPIQEGSAPGMK